MALSLAQKENLKGIIRACKTHYADDHPVRRAVIATMTSLTESGLNNYASANVPESQKYDHQPVLWEPDGLGHDHASMGMFQQQTGTKWALPGTTTMTTPDGWGTPKELMNPEVSTYKFLKALDSVTGWYDMHSWQAAQAVQHSAFADGSNYHKNRSRARRLVLRYFFTIKIDKKA